VPDGFKQGDEECDCKGALSCTPAQIGNKNCSSINEKWTSGVLKCDSNCKFNTSLCYDADYSKDTCVPTGGKNSQTCTKTSQTFCWASNIKADIVGGLGYCCGDDPSETWVINTNMGYGADLLLVDSCWQAKWQSRIEGSSLLYWDVTS
jgi:hypothetical protein